MVRSPSYSETWSQNNKYTNKQKPIWFSLQSVEPIVSGVLGMGPGLSKYFNRGSTLQPASWRRLSVWLNYTSWLQLQLCWMLNLGPLFCMLKSHSPGPQVTRPGPHPMTLSVKGKLLQGQVHTMERIEGVGWMSSFRSSLGQIPQSLKHMILDYFLELRETTYFSYPSIYLSVHLSICVEYTSLWPSVGSRENSNFQNSKRYPNIQKWPQQGL